MVTKLPLVVETVFSQWRSQGITILEYAWTTSLKRHIGAKINMPNGTPAFAKLSLIKRKDQDEPEMRGGMLRETWWSRRIADLQDRMPFSSPSIIETNVHEQDFNSEVAWVIMEDIVRGQGAKPIFSENPTEEEFEQEVGLLAQCLIALDRTTPHYLEELGILPPDSPPPSHVTRKWKKVGLVQESQAVLGNGAFELKNFFRTASGKVYIIDNEFAGWLPRYDSLTYMYHRLRFNMERPELAKMLLTTYRDNTLLNMPEFALLLRHRLLSGFVNDFLRRRVMPWNKRQLLRITLWWKLYLEQYDGLV